MALYLVTPRSTILAADANQLIDIFSQQSGGQEIGKYQCQGNSFISGGFIGYYAQSLSRVSVPVSASVDTTDQAPTNVNTPTTLGLTSGGFRIHESTTGITTSGKSGGGYVLQF